MAEHKRTDAQRAADARYAAKNPNRTKAISFNFSTSEAEEIEKKIAEIITLGIVPTKAEFLRKALRYFETLI
jgi:hypothetical protein